MNVHTEEAIGKLRRSGEINAKVHRSVRAALGAGVSTGELDEIAIDVLRQNQALSSFQRIFGYPAAICVSVNEQVGHGIPGQRTLCDGDLVKVDVGVEYDGYHTDCAMTHVVGVASSEILALVSVTREALQRGISCVKPGRRVSDVSYEISQTFEGTGYHVIRHAFGHGIGQSLHESPQIANFGPANRGPRLRSGMALAIEPLVSLGSKYTRTLDDGWTTVTTDGSLCAHFEHTVLVTDEGPEILTEAENNGVAEFFQSLSIRHIGEFMYRPKVKSDNDPLVEITRREMNPILIEAWGRPVIPSEVTDDPDASTIVIESKSGDLAGFYSVKVKDGVMHLKTIVIDSKFQGQGLGSACLTAVEESARRRGLGTVELCVQSNNSKALGFYRKFGYSSVATPFYRTILMRKTL